MRVDLYSSPVYFEGAGFPFLIPNFNGCNGDWMGHSPLSCCSITSFQSAGDEVSEGNTGCSEEERNTSSHAHSDTGTADNVSFSPCSWSLRGTS